ncbi:MAG: AAA family ATPase [Sedimentibacter sp.]
MALHMSLRLAWHDNGWNGHVCNNPQANGYCIGKHSYPGDAIGNTRDLDYECKHCGDDCSTLDKPVACSLSVNAFGNTHVTALVDPPEWWNNEAEVAEVHMEPCTACTWCYEEMYTDGVLNQSNSPVKYDNNKRLDNAKKYFSDFEEGKSLVFYYAGYSNPFSEEGEDNYIIVGLSRIKKIHDFMFYNGVSEHVKENYANGIVWQKPITSCYPDQGLRIPYEKYIDNEAILNRIVFKPENRRPFKYGTRAVSNDDAINIVWRFIEIVDVLIEVGDTTENWEYRKEWLNSLLSELWINRGPYPGLPSVFSILGLEKVISEYLKHADIQLSKKIYEETKELLLDNGTKIGSVVFNERDLKSIKRRFELRDENEQKLLLDIMPRFDITKEQIEAILSDDREKVSIRSTIEEILSNPYIIFEQYVGYDADDIIPFYKIDNGILPSPEVGLETLLDADSAERLRAFCVDELNHIAAHSFGKAETILGNINNRISRMKDWRQHVFKMQNFKVDYDILSKAIFIKEHENNKYIYLKNVYDDERVIEDTFTSLARKPDITLKSPISIKLFKEELIQKDSELLRVATERYEEILNSQAETCMKIFNKPIVVLSGAAGTGKTTVIKALINNIERVHGIGTGFLLMAPTGKATERIKRQTGKKSTTIHSFLAKNGWINDNFTLKRHGGMKQSDINTIIIDECSMIDLNLFATLIRAINWNSVQRLILVGDPNQLPPIGRGKVFSDTIEWLRKDFPDNIGVLTENIRQLVNKVQSVGTGILELAQIFIQEEQNNKEKIETGKEELFQRIQVSGEIDKDLDVYYWKDQSELETMVKNVLIKDMESITGQACEDGNEWKLWNTALKDENDTVQPERIQVVSPYRGEFYGTDEINRYMQKVFNSKWYKRVSIDGISLFDKVIQYRNRPQSDMAYAYNLSAKKTERYDIYNGEIGMVKVHGFDSKKINFLNWIEKFQVVFSGKNREGLWYNYGKSLGKDDKGRYIPEQKPIDNLELAYAISVHKSQGSEFDYVYLIVPKRDSHLLSMELLYTAITRAQKHLTMFIQDDIGTLVNLSRIEKSGIRRINSSVFEFNPLPEEFLYFNNWYSAGKTLATLTKYLVRSKSEVIIANLLFSKEIPFTYEEPLYAKDGTMYLPDFTVTFRGEKYYWEHVGMLNKEDYRKHWEEKENWYNINFPGRLLTTFESDTLTLDAKKIIEEHI